MPGIKQPGAGFHSTALDAAIQGFEKEHSTEASAIIMASETAQIEYVYNRTAAFERLYPPGSLAKVWAAAVFLENRSPFDFDPSRIVDCRGFFTIPQGMEITRDDRSVFNLVKDTQGREALKCSLANGHGNVDLRRALALSCNVYFLTIATRNPEIFFETMSRMWMLDRNTQADLNSREAPSVRPSRLTVLQMTAGAYGEGGGILLSPLKIGQTFAALFSGTPLLRPFEQQRRGSPLQQGELAISEASRRIILSSLRETVAGGTLKNLVPDSPAIEILGGKTGSASQYRHRYATHAWNVIHFEKSGHRSILIVFVNQGTGRSEARSLTEKIFHAM